MAYNFCNLFNDNILQILSLFFIIHKNKIGWYKKTYYDKVDFFFKNNLLIKDDQYIILHCLANNINDFLLLKDTNVNSWFIFKKFLL